MEGKWRLDVAVVRGEIKRRKLFTSHNYCALYWTVVPSGLRSIENMEVQGSATSRLLRGFRWVQEASSLGCVGNDAHWPLHAVTGLAV